MSPRVFVMVRVALGQARLLPWQRRGSQARRGPQQAQVSPSVLGEVSRDGGDSSRSDTPVSCSAPWLQHCPVCVALLKRRQECRVGCTGPFESFCSAVGLHPKPFLCLGDSDHPWLSSERSAPKPMGTAGAGGPGTGEGKLPAGTSRAPWEVGRPLPPLWLLKVSFPCRLIWAGMRC